MQMSGASRGSSVQSSLKRTKRKAPPPPTSPSAVVHNPVSQEEPSQGWFSFNPFTSKSCQLFFFLLFTFNCLCTLKCIKISSFGGGNKIDTTFYKSIPLISFSLTFVPPCGYFLKVHLLFKASVKPSYR